MTNEQYILGRMMYLYRLYKENLAINNEDECKRIMERLDELRSVAIIYDIKYEDILIENF